MINGKESFAYVIQRLCQKFNREILQSAHGFYLCKVLAFVLQPSKSCVLKMRIHKPCVTILLFFEWLTALLLLNCHQFTDGSGQFNAIFDSFSTILSGIRQVYSHTAVELQNSFDLPTLLCMSSSSHTNLSHSVRNNCEVPYLQSTLLHELHSTDLYLTSQQHFNSQSTSTLLTTGSSQTINLLSDHLSSNNISYRPHLPYSKLSLDSASDLCSTQWWLNPLAFDHTPYSSCSLLYSDHTLISDHNGLSFDVQMPRMTLGTSTELDVTPHLLHINVYANSIHTIPVLSLLDRIYLHQWNALCLCYFLQYNVSASIAEKVLRVSLKCRQSFYRKHDFRVLSYVAYLQHHRPFMSPCYSIVNDLPQENTAYIKFSCHMALKKGGRN